MAKADILAPHFQDVDKAREYLEALRGCMARTARIADRWMPITH
ncbi:hypothetical protein [Dokdonella sp.]